MFTTLLLLPLGGVVSEAKLSSITEPMLPLTVADQFGQSAAAAGDVDGDGVIDLISGAPYDDAGGEDFGAAHILFLEADGSIRETRTISATEGGFTGDLDAGDLFGWAVAGLGDLDADGVPDVAVGARRDDDEGTDRGAIYVLFLNASGTVKSHQKISSGAGGFSGDLLDGDQFGWSLGTLGDVDGDGVNDLAAGMQQALGGSSVWPAEFYGTDISAGLGTNWEPSGTIWNPVSERLALVSDQGRVATMDADGSNVNVVTIGGDIEGITLRDPDTSLVYLGYENPDSIREFDLATGQLTGLSWSLTPWMQGPVNAGLEALTWAKGQFYAGHEGEGAIYVFNTEDSGDVWLDRIIPSPMGLQSLCGLHYEETTDTLYCLYRNKRVIETDLDGNVLRTWVLHGIGSHQEGITLMTECPASEARIVLAQDTGKVFRYDGYPANCSGPESLPGRGALWTLLLNSDGTVKHQTRIGHQSGGFTGEISHGDRFGAALAAPGDIDGDGIVDLAVGAPFDDDGGPDRGAVWLVQLNVDGSAKEATKVSALSGIASLLDDDDQFGWSLVAGGDLDLNGVTDLVVGSPGADCDGFSRGAVDVLHLGTGGAVIGHERLVTEATLTNFDQFGTALVGDLDLDGDGVLDVVVGAAFDDDGGSNTGALWELFRGATVPGSALPYGCIAAANDTLSVVAGTPTLGGTMSVRVSNPYGTQSMGSMTVLIFAREAAPGFPCGIEMPYWGMPGVDAPSEILLGAVPQYWVVPGPPLGSAEDGALIEFGLPPGAEFLGSSFYAQAVIWDPIASGSVETSLTSGLELIIGG